MGTFSEVSLLTRITFKVVSFDAHMRIKFFNYHSRSRIKSQCTFVTTKVDVAICILKSRLIGQTGREKNLLGPLRELPNILCLFKLQVLDPVWKQHPVYEFLLNADVKMTVNTLYAILAHIFIDKGRPQ